MNALRLFFSVAAVALLLGGLPLMTLAQTTRFVSTTGTNSDPTSATSWATSTTHLQGAINSLSVTGGEVWVAQGVYKPGGNTNTNRSISFSMANSVTIIGGFVGSETALSGRPAINPVTGQPSSSTLSGEIGNPSSTTDNSYHVIRNPTSLSLTTTAVLDGFVITGGNADGDSPNDVGGGMYNNGDGAGQFCNPLIQNCMFVANDAKTGGAIANVGFLSGISDPTLISCLFQNNTATNFGGAMANVNFSSVTSNPTLINCVFQNNTASFGGGMTNQDTNPTLINCSFQRNTASSDGGAIRSVGYLRISSPNLTNCSFQSNTAPDGGAMANVGFSGGTSNLSLTNCVLFDNGGNNTIFNGLGSTLTATYSLFEPASITVTGVTLSGPGNLTVTTSPFASTTGTQLAPCSPAIDAGDPATTSAMVGTTDLAGNSRFFNNGRVDMGAVEFQGAVVPTSFSVLGSGTAPCASSPTISLSGSETGISYQLRRDGTSVGSSLTGTGSALSFGPQSLSGLYTVLATNTTCSSTLVMAQSATVLSNTNAPTGANLSASNSGTLTCSAQTLTLTASATPGTPGSLSYVFAGPSGTLAGSGNTRPVSATGLYSVTITGANGCTTSASTTVFSNSAAPTAGLVASGTITCAVPAVTLTASGGAGLPGGTYSFAGPSIVSISGNSATVNVGGTYSVTVLNPVNGCFNSTTLSVSSDLGGAPAAPILSASSSVVCEGTNVLVVASGGGSSPMQWYRNGQAVGGQSSATLSLGGVQQAQAGSYVLVVAGGTAFRVCSVTSAPFNLTVNPLPTVTITVPQGATVVGPGTGVATITLPAPLTSVAMQVFGGTQYERLIVLDRINGFEIRQVDQNTNGIFNVNRPGPFRLTVTDGNGCQRTVEGVVVVAQ